jgi:apolipoprotein D and lipocalin family protein
VFRGGEVIMIDSTHLFSGLPLALGLVLALVGCASTSREPLPTVEFLDIERFMGDWYVIANIPTRLEKGAHNAVESYRLDEKGRVATTFTFRDGGFDGKVKRYEPFGFVRENSGNAVWGMRFIWPIKAEYRVMYVDSDYQTTIIGRTKRDYLWIMAREPKLPESQLESLISIAVEAGYDPEAVELVPQRWD